MKQTKSILKNVNVDQLERTLDKCLMWFYAYPRTKIGLTDLARYIRSSKTATKQVIESLVQIQFLNKDVIGKAWLLYANQKHPYFITKKIPYNLTIIYESGVLDAIHKSIPSPRAIVLFGSYRWGSDVEDSDIDIAVEVVNNQELQIIRLGEIEQLGYRKNVPVNLHIFSRNKIDLNLFANIVNGIVLDGFMEARV
ncbi:MAG: nucleotidyltransferase domain-containing protein [Candidatus Nanoarchaeia archaeon]|nr:nucleotidyltransferase domain-containing protein [Candidatus Nanoarchaeia archaeon]MDD5740897.1 nucleotidyltransferase domain-containing protein [Candidatus Nanoarchaeia archaeon]